MQNINLPTTIFVNNMQQFFEPSLSVESLMNEKDINLNNEILLKIHNFVSQ